jgi:hypothetical protein
MSATTGEAVMGSNYSTTVNIVDKRLLKLRLATDAILTQYIEIPPYSKPQATAKNYF